MAIPDAAVIAQQAQKLGLLNEHQIVEGWEEMGQRGGEALPFLLAMERRGYLTPWQSQKLIKGDPDGYFLGGYRILYKISSGTFGRVFRADDPQSGRVVAVKILRRRYAEDQDKIGLFEREGKVGMTLHHPNIVEILAINKDAGTGQWYIVMEFVEGGNLREILKIRKKLEPLEALRIMEDVTAGLSYASSRGITHRDMKLSNILVASQGTAKLVDFGLAGMFGGQGKEDDKQEARTVDYAGLEKATGVKQGDVRSDIYFLGCVLYEMLTGRSPITMTRDKHARMQKHRFDSAQTLKRDEVKGPPSLFRLVETMMSLNPSQRFQTPSQLLEAIRGVRRELEGKDTGATTAASAPRAIFVVERDERLQDAIRDKLKELGYRVFMAADPDRALDRYRQQPYDGVIMDVGTVGEDGLDVLADICREAARHDHPCAGIVILSEEQAEWKSRVPAYKSVVALVRPGVTLKTLQTALQNLVPLKAPA